MSWPPCPNQPNTTCRAALQKHGMTAVQQITVSTIGWGTATEFQPDRLKSPRVASTTRTKDRILPSRCATPWRFGRNASMLRIHDAVHWQLVCALTGDSVGWKSKVASPKLPARMLPGLCRKTNATLAAPASLDGLEPSSKKILVVSLTRRARESDGRVPARSNWF